MRALAVGYVAALVAIPLGALAIAGIREGPRAILSALGRAEIRDALALTLAIAAAVAVVNALIGTLTAFVLVRCRFPGRRVFDALIDLPGMIPPFVAGVAMSVVLGSGLVGLGPFRWPADAPRPLPPIVLLAPLLFVTYPIVVRTVEPALRLADREAENDARAVGAGAGPIRRRNLLPAILPAVVSGALATLARAAGEFGAVILLVDWRAGAARPAAVVLADSVNADRAGATALALLALAAALVVAAHATAAVRAARWIGGDRGAHPGSLA